MDSSNHCNLVPILGVTEEDLALFKQAQEKANAAMNLDTTTPLVPSTRSPPLIQFGRYEIVTWYSSPYPQEYARYKLKFPSCALRSHLSFRKGLILLSFGYLVSLPRSCFCVVTQRSFSRRGVSYAVFSRPLPDFLLKGGGGCTQVVHSPLV